MLSLFKKQNSKMATNKDLITQVAEQFGEEIAQQLAQSIDQQSEKQTSQDISVSRENKFEEIGYGEAMRASVYVDKEMMTINKKHLLAWEQKEKELQHAEREAKLRKQAALDAIEISERENAALIKHLANTLLVDFRTAAYHPISPNDKDSED